MPVIDRTKEEDTKQQIIEELNTVPADKLPGILEYVRSVSINEEWSLDPSPLTERELELIQEALDDPRADVPHSEVRKMLGL
jgi:hypothetical protein